MIKVEVEVFPFKRWAITVNGVVFRRMNINPFMLKGSYVSENAWINAFFSWEKKEVKRVAYEALSRRPFLREELEKKLKAYGFSESCILPLLEELKAFGYLNDEEQSEKLVLQGIRKKKSPAWIQNRLSEKGGVFIDMEALYPEELRKEIIREFLIKHQKKGEKAIGMAQRRGFSLGEVLFVYNNLQKCYNGS